MVCKWVEGPETMRGWVWCGKSCRAVELSRWEVQPTPWSERELRPAWRGSRVSEVRLEKVTRKSEVRIESLALVSSYMVAPLLTILGISILLGTWQ